MAKIVFMGTPEIAVPSLIALHEAGHQIAAVVTQPDRPKGRGQKQTPPPIKLAAESLGLRVLQPDSIKTEPFVQELNTLQLDAMVVVAFGKILPPQILKIPRWGCLNEHFSLLPKYRGAACIAYPLLHGETQTGVTSMIMDEGLDTGPILLQWLETIQKQDTSASLAERLSRLGAQQIVETLEGLEAGKLQAIAQTEENASYAPMLKKSQGQVDWSQSAESIFNLYRAMTPWPGVFTFWEGKRMILNELELAELKTPIKAAELHWMKDQGLLIGCGQGGLRILKLKPEGKKLLSAEQFMRGIEKGKTLNFG